MNEEQQAMAVNQSATPAEQQEVVQQQPTNFNPERTYTRDQVTDMMRRRVERSHNAFFSRYGVKDLNGLDELFDKSNKFTSMQDEYGAIQLKNSDLARENAFIRNKIDPQRYEDIITYFRGKGIDFTEEEMLNALKTHPEWLKKSNNVVQMTTLGSEAHNNPVETGEAKQKRIFGI